MKTTVLVVLFLASTPLLGQKASASIYLTVLGTVQDGGSPHIGCQKKCCLNLSLQEIKTRKVTALEVFDTTTKKSLLFEATPDVISQWATLRFPLCGIFLTHAHIGHYSGLLQLGREALGAKKNSRLCNAQNAHFFGNECAVEPIGHTAKYHAQKT